MELKDQWQVVNLELSMKIKELGVEQDSLWYWRVQNKEKVLNSEIIRKPERFLTEEVHLEPKEKSFDTAYWDSISAFTVAELLDLLPFYLVDLGELTLKKNYRRHELTGYNVRYEKTINCRGDSMPTICDNTAANTLAGKAIYLLENNLIK